MTACLKPDQIRMNSFTHFGITQCVWRSLGNSFYTNTISNVIPESLDICPQLQLKQISQSSVRFNFFAFSIKLSLASTIKFNIEDTETITTFIIHEGHSQPLFGVQFNPFLPEKRIFATVGTNRVTVYQCVPDNQIVPIQCYTDADRRGLLAVGGVKGIIRILRSFPILEVHFLKYSTREIYRNYIDCVRWFGRLAFSKSCENSLILWRPPRPDDKPQQKSFQVLQKFEVLNCEIWYIRFAMDRKMKCFTLQIKRICILKTYGFYLNVSCNDSTKSRDSNCCSNWFNKI
uniref:Uncharacterized protein n=1 Tax=Amphimedon queenslandica TaxID=400682 RepID=A0A1X7TDJ3_AMPQE